MIAENYKSTAKMFRQLCNNCVVLLEKVGVDKPGIENFKTLSNTLTRECWAIYSKKRYEEINKEEKNDG